MYTVAAYSPQSWVHSEESQLICSHISPAALCKIAGCSEMWMVTRMRCDEGEIGEGEEDEEDEKSKLNNV